ncbi:hypothetical protein RQP46_005429 [Phenoliferia psychrophenolica]
MPVVKDRSIKVAVDRGGTFTDVHASWPVEGEPDREIILKLLSTTVATNSLLERQGAPHALLVTKGFKDLLEIGNQSRPKIFDLNIRRPGVLYSTVLEVDERVTLLGYTSDPNRVERAVVFSEDGKVEKGYDGEVYAEGEVVRGLSGEAVQILKKIDVEGIEKDLQKLYDEGYRSLAIVFMHAFTYPDHEQQVGALASKIGFTNLSLSSSSLPMIRIVARGTSTTADAYLTPVLRAYIDGFFAGFDPSLRETSLKESTSADELSRTTSVEFMRSDGGLTDVGGFSGLKSILSGPAGGVVGYALTSWEKGGKAVIGLDMGGTSTDVSRFDGTYETVFETTTAGITIQSPQLNIETVAAGGGSRLFFRNGLFVTGPESAGSDPGPACYRKNGPPAITDANLVLGRLLPEHFPKIFGESEREPLDVEASRLALEKLANEVNAETGKNLSVDEVAWGFIKVANETMSRPIRSLTEARGYDTSRHILSSFGGAGGQHACAIASTLGITTILVHRYSSILSAYGMALAERVFERQEPSSETWSHAGAEVRLKARLALLASQVQKELERQGFRKDRIEIQPFLNMRYNGTDSALMTLQPESGTDFAGAFAQAYNNEFGFSMNVDIIIDDVRVRGVGKSFDSLGPSVFTEAKGLTFKTVDVAPAVDAKCSATTSVYYESIGRTDAPVFLLERLDAGDLIKGPAMIIDGTQTIVIDPNATAKITSKHVLIELEE